MPALEHAVHAEHAGLHGEGLHGEGPQQLLGSFPPAEQLQRCLQP